LNRPSRHAHGPNRAAALEQYRRRAGVYDLELAPFESIRRKAIDRLELKRGDVVLDVGCGTGLSFGLLRQGIGSRGRIIGIEQSPDMLALARERAGRDRLKGLRLVCSPVETASFAGCADVALFHFTHDILQRPEAVANVVRHLAPGARVVACGLQWAAAWAVPTNLVVLAAALRSVTSLEGLHQPWGGLARYFNPLDVETMWADGVYLASGRLAIGG
jgi:ubiquinone/menaquinone biosynthesis C-methylase UbiE